MYLGKYLKWQKYYTDGPVFFVHFIFHKRYSNEHYINSHSIIMNHMHNYAQTVYYTSNNNNNNNMSGVCVFFLIYVQ